MSSKPLLELNKFSVSAGDKQILSDISLSIIPGTITLILGRNGAGKSTLLRAILGVDELVSEGDILLDGEQISSLSIDERARKGLFVGFQAPIEVPGVQMVEFLRIAHNHRHPTDKYDPWTFNEIFEAYCIKVGLPAQFSERNLNENFSGGEKKKSELLQMLLMKPKYAFLDEVDSGLDLASLKQVFEVIREFADEKQVGVALISHNPNILEYISPDRVILLDGGRLAQEGDIELARELIKTELRQAK